MTSTVSASTEQKKRAVRRLVASGRGFAEAYGLPVTNNPASLFQVLYLAVLLRSTGDVARPTATAQALRDHGWDSPARMARSLAEARTGVLRDNGWRGEALDLSVALGDLARTLVERYRGDLRRVRVEAQYRPERERALLTGLPGVDGVVVDLFLRDVQALWGEVAPVADRRALAAARKLGLGRSAADLAELAGSDESERLAWLVGALARTDVEGRYGEFRELTG